MSSFPTRTRGGVPAGLHARGAMASVGAAGVSVAADTGAGHVDTTTIDAPVVIPCVGHIVVFGLSNAFDETYPARLAGKLAPDEFRTTIRKINRIVRGALPHIMRCFLLGYVLCCCTAGLTLLPSLIWKAKVRQRVAISLLAARQPLLVRRRCLQWNGSLMQRTRASITSSASIGSCSAPSRAMRPLTYALAASCFFPFFHFCSPRTPAVNTYLC